MLSVMVILLSEMNSYRMRVAIAVFSPSSAPCLVFALRETNNPELFFLSVLSADGETSERFPTFYPPCCR